MHTVTLERPVSDSKAAPQDADSIGRLPPVIPAPPVPRHLGADDGPETSPEIEPNGADQAGSYLPPYRRNSAS